MPGPTTPPVGTRFSTGEDRALLAGPSSAPAGAVVVTPGTSSDLGTITAANPAGTTFYLLAGNHVLGGTNPNEFNQIVPKAGNIYVGAPGAILDGRWTNRSSFTGSATGVTIRYLEIINFVCLLEQMMINSDGAAGWIVEYCHIHHNRGAAAGMATNFTGHYNWIHDNEQYAYSSHNKTIMPNGGVVPQADHVVLDHNEIHNNGDVTDEFNPDGSMTGNGRNGTLKFWDTSDMQVRQNWIHNSNAVSVWCDTNNVQMLLEDNLIEDSWGEGFFYEISYNFVAQNNTFRRCAVAKGLSWNYRSDNFPISAIYISESGSEPRLTGFLYNTQSEIHDNTFDNNWADVTLWENPDRHCNSRGNTSAEIWKPLGGAATLTECQNPNARTFQANLTAGSDVFTITTNNATYPLLWTDNGSLITGTGIPAGTRIRYQQTSPEDSERGITRFTTTPTSGRMTANATQTGNVQITLSGGQINTAPYVYDCRWHTQRIRTHHNDFKHNRSQVLGTNTLTSGVRTGKTALISGTGTVEAWATAYHGEVIKDQITFNAQNVWDTNTYTGNYDFMPYDTGGNATFTQWQAAPYSQDASSTFTATPVSGSVPAVAITRPPPPATCTATAGNGSAKVEFPPPVNYGGDAIVGYTVTASPGGATATAKTGPITVTGLTNGTAYTFTVRSRSSIGLSTTASAASNSVTPTSGSSFPATSPPWVPLKPWAFNRNGVAEVYFFAPYSTGGSAITSYTATASNGATATSTTNPVKITGLADGNYTFKVAATNAAGTGPETLSTNQITIGSVSGTVPDAPTGVTATAGNAQASVSFTAPANNGGNTITSYTVTSSPGGITATGASSPITVSALTNGTAYTFTVTATNAVGTGPASAASNSVTPTSGGGGGPSGGNVLDTWARRSGISVAVTDIKARRGGVTTSIVGRNV